MPEMDGYATAQYVRNKMHITTPIIALTAHSSSGEREKCMELGMNDYMTKPYRSKDLYYKIVRAIRPESGEEKVSDSEEQEFSTPLKALAAGDKDFEIEMLEMMLKSFPEDCAKLNAAYEEENFVTVKSVAHRMKSSLALAGETELAGLLNQLEEAPHFDDRTNELLARIYNEKSGLLERIEDQIELLR